MVNSTAVAVVSVILVGRLIEGIGGGSRVKMPNPSQFLVCYSAVSLLFGTFDHFQLPQVVQKL